jgi:dihydrofolate synthase / folylpolyglutamate synthase
VVLNRLTSFEPEHVVNTAYRQAIQYLYDNLPMFQRVGAVAYKKDLTNTIQLCEVLGNPHHKFKSIHVAGTNGKGSTSHMIASILQSSEYRTGLYTSPHLKEFTERIKVNGQEVEQDFVVDFVARIKPWIEKIRPSFFEITVAMAFDYFAKQQVDVAVIEVGLGGRLDSTNIITPVLSVITNIGWDHKDILGDTLQKIATEKAGIIKPDVPVVVSERQREVEAVFEAKAGECNAEISFASDAFAVQSKGDLLRVSWNGKLVYDDIDLPLKGIYQQKNLPGVLKAVDVLRMNGFNISDHQLLSGLENVTTQTNFKGRWQKLRDNPLVICDTGHNVDGIREIVRQISATPFDKLHIVLGMVKDKDVTDVLSLLPKDATYYFCQAKLPRALDANVLAAKAKEHGLTGSVISDVNDAKDNAVRNAQPGDMVFIGGSTFVVAELNEL